jgi:predicted lactoylglutathione lyase
MPSMIFVNLPVRDVKASMAYYKALGFDHNPQFTDDSAACIVFSETIFAMVMMAARFKEFTNRPIPNAHTSTGALYAFSMSSRAEVDRIADAALAAGGSAFRPAEDMGFMYLRAIADPDGHVWEYNYMDMSQFPAEGGSA